MFLISPQVWCKDGIQPEGTKEDTNPFCFPNIPEENSNTGRMQGVCIPGKYI